jgi:hypothetical protein
LDSRLAVCGDPQAKDRQLKQSIIDRFGGDNIAVGGVRCPDCNDGKIWRTGPCEACESLGEVQGNRGLKRCPECKGRRHIRVRVPCATCGGSQMLYPPGVLAGYNPHEYSALAAAICYIEMPEHRKRR